MRTRLTAAILVLVAVTVVVTSLGSYFLVRRADVSTAQRELVGQGRAIARTISDHTFPTAVSFRRELRIIRRAGAFRSLKVVELHPGGHITGTLPAGINVPELHVRSLLDGIQTAGHSHQLLIFTAVPAPITGVSGYVPLLVITRQGHDPAGGLHYFVLIGAVALAVAALVATVLVRRFTGPLAAAATTTGRIAGGDLEATMPESPHYPELTQLARSINSMGASLGRARQQERQFLLSVSHELRTPLTSIRGYAEAIVDGAAPDPVVAAEIIESESVRLQRLVQDLLDLARLDANRFSLSIRPVDCVAVARRVAQGFGPQADQLGLELVPALVADPPLWVLADPDRLGQIVANLLENAARFAAQRITVGAGRVGASPAIWVVDDGSGISADNLGRVFDRHYTSDDNSPEGRSGRHIGSGLGLAIVSELAKAMGARVTAESPAEGGHGTRMVICLQAGAAPPVEDGAAGAASAQRVPGSN